MTNTRKLCFSAMMLAVGILLPMVFHAIPNAGSVFAPMHLPVFVAGFIAGPFYGALVGMMCPLFSSVFTGMPALPVLPNMMTEMLIYGGVSGVLFRVIKTKSFVLDVYLSLILSMLLGRIAGGIVVYLLFVTGTRATYSWAAFFTGYFVTCLPAIAIQLAVVPATVLVAKKARFIGDGDRYLDPDHHAKNIKKQREFFDGIADGWRKNSVLSESDLAGLFEDIPLNEGERVLDVGCGSGVLDGFLIGRGLTVDAIDISERMIEKAKENEANRGVNYAVADFYGYMGGYGYDAIFVFDAYPHFTDKSGFALKAAELLKEGGRLYIMFDESREKINGYHGGSASGISVDLKPAATEAETFKNLFEVLSVRDDEERYLLALSKKLSINLKK